MIMTKMTTTTTTKMMMILIIVSPPRPPPPRQKIKKISWSLPGWIQYSPILFDFLFFVWFLDLANVYILCGIFNSYRWFTISTYQQQKPFQAPEDRLQIGETWFVFWWFVSYLGGVGWCDIKPLPYLRPIYMNFLSKSQPWTAVLRLPIRGYWW